MSDLIIREFQGKKIRQREDGYLSLTDMAKVSKKLISNWERLKATQDYLEALALRNYSDVTNGQLIDIVQGGIPQNQGTWGYRKVAIRFAQWLNPEFAITVDEWAEEIITKGGYIAPTATSEQLEALQQKITILQQERNILRSWSPSLSMPKIRFLEIINYKGDEYSPFLQRNGCKEYQQKWEVKDYLKQMEEKKMFMALIDTLFGGKKLDLWVEGFKDSNPKKAFAKFQDSLPVKLYRVLVNPYQDYPAHQQPRPSEEYKEFQFSVELKEQYGSVWLEFVPEKEEKLKSFLYASELVA